MVAPIVPAINDREIEAILDECAKAGATAAGYVVLRLPLEIKDLFREWLQQHFPDRAARVATRTVMRTPSFAADSMDRGFVAGEIVYRSP